MSPAPRRCGPAVHPVASAKIELLKRLEASGSTEATLLADELLDARTLHELAARARAITFSLAQSDGRKVSETFWEHAKRILLRWRDAASES